jgi:hypothetical protein
VLSLLSGGVRGEERLLSAPLENMKPTHVCVCIPKLLKNEHREEEGREKRDYRTNDC